MTHTRPFEPFATPSAESKVALGTTTTWAFLYTLEKWPRDGFCSWPTSAAACRMITNLIRPSTFFYRWTRGLDKQLEEMYEAIWRGLFWPPFFQHVSFSWFGNKHLKQRISWSPWSGCPETPQNKPTTAIHPKLESKVALGTTTTWAFLYIYICIYSRNDRGMDFAADQQVRQCPVWSQPH